MSKMASTSNPLVFARGACMECRRLKTKCDRAVPCAPCVRRGCESICPSGLRARGSRNPGAEVEQLNRNIQSMTARIRQLEDALQVAHAQSSGSGSPATPPGVHGSLIDHNQSEFSSLASTRSRLGDQAEAAQRQHILSIIPEENTARVLVESFTENYGWVMKFVSRNQLFDCLLKRVYSTPCTASNSELSALCSVFSMAASGDMQQQAGHLDSWLTTPVRFHELSMAALRINDILVDTSVSTIEAMAFQCFYLYIASESDQVQRAWNYLGITIRMAYSIGLHHDPKLLNLDDEECGRRRRLFHELITLEAWMCMIIERPTSVQGAFYSTEMPYDTHDTLGDDPSFFRWKHDFCREALLPIVSEVTCAVVPPTYSTVLRVDKLCRACTFPSKLQFVDFSNAPMEVLLQSQQLFLMQELALIKLHKAEFLRALEDYPDDPFKSHAAYSVQTIIDSSTSLLKRLRTISTDCARLLPRLSCPWEAAIAALSYLSVFLHNFKNEAIANPIYIEFEMGCKLVMDHAGDTSRIAKLIPHAMELRRSVHETAPHLTQNLRRALSERRRAESTGIGNPSTTNLEYPLGPSLSPPHTLSSFPFAGMANNLGSSITEQGSGGFFSSILTPTSNNSGPFDGADFGSFAPTCANMGTSMRFEVPSSNTLGEDSAMFPFDDPTNPNTTNGGQPFVQGGHFTPSF